MSPYTLVATVVALAVHLLLPRNGLRSFAGSVMVGLIWPVLIPMGLYFGVKVWGLGYPMAKAEVLDVEVLGCVFVTGVALGWMLVHRGVLALR